MVPKDSNVPATSSSNKDRVVKKRASQACHHCRTRKVKCDLMKSGVPCHNCESDGIECVVVESRRSRKYRLQKRQLTGLVTLPPLKQAQSTATEDSHSNEDIGEEAFKDPVVPAAGAPAHTPTARVNILQSPVGTNSGHNIDGIRYWSVSRNVRAASSSQSASSAVNLPSYIRAVRPSIKGQDIDFLSYRGALALPNDDLRDQLLRCFVLYVYTYMPIVDLEELLGAIDGTTNGPKVSLTLFQAVMFAGSAFVDLELLKNAGYDNRRAARADYYQKVKLLYDFDWDVDRIALIQSLLLINYWYVSETDQKDPWHWCGVCVSLSVSLGLDQRITYHQRDLKTCHLWRRIWWACVMRDRITAVSMRRPMRIKDEDINLIPLWYDDFDIQPINTSIVSLKGLPFLTVPTLRKSLAEMCIAKINLLLTMGHIIRDLYHLRVFGGSTAQATMLYKPKASRIEPAQLSKLGDELAQWYRDLPGSCWVLLPSSENVRRYDSATEDALFLHRALLRMTYLLATENLSRPQMLSKGMSTDSTNNKVKDAADDIAEMVQRLQKRDLVKFLPPFAVSFMLFALAAFLVEIKTKGQNLPGQQFHHCVRALWQLRDIWPIADSACFLIGQMIAKSQVGGISTPGIQPGGISYNSRVKDEPSQSNDVQRETQEIPQPPPIGQFVEQAHTNTSTVDMIMNNNSNNNNNITSMTALDQHHHITNTSTSMDLDQLPTDLMSGSMTFLDMNDPTLYEWTGSEFDGANYAGAVITNGHALHMDFAFDGLGSDFQNNLLGFGPSSNDLDQLGLDMPYTTTSTGVPRAALTGDWDPHMQNPFMG
ncbi:hypothetical protein PV08_04836 [Exophiala spinifera]|uniref:Zn(2)-C6 fungal-type domain-containing protein n=1 Tax=Exophiala spinifera TaxID=91928 RepID=A0A0D1YQY7_9EURO|nr:uncharacterized protein PV08_04836 [Exophiala spinifera]KIW17641.1 hypothetical protein PV08_04836 [Exophiala spinifera]